MRLLDLDLPTGSPARKDTNISLFDIPFEVPYRNATRDLEGITSHTLFSTFLVRLSQRMDVGVTFLSAIGYVPSFLPKSSKPRPKLLEDEASWNKLVKDVHEYRENCKKKNKGKGQVPAFTISLTDTSNGDGKENKKVSTYSLYNISYSNLLQSGTSKKKSDEPAIPALSSDEVKDLEAIKDLEKRWQCQEHNKTCLVQHDGQHYELTISDKAKWGHLLVRDLSFIC